MSKLKIDHITIASPDLAPQEEQLNAIGLKTSYGGRHSNGITHMSMVSFPDGSYIELIAKIVTDRPSPLWNRAIVENAGICAWAIETSDVALECQRLLNLGVPVKAPQYMHRQTPTGAQAEWDLAFVGEHEPGAKLPFIIKDRTAREIRVPRPSDSELTGINYIILGVEDLETSVNLFRQIYHLDAPILIEEDYLAAQLAYFTEAPLMLATPLNPQTGQLSQKLQLFGDIPIGLLIGTNDMPRTKTRLSESISKQTEIVGKEVIWLNPATLIGTNTGFIST